MNYGMQYFATVVGLTAQDAAQHIPVLIDYGKQLVVVVTVHCGCCVDNRLAKVHFFVYLPYDES